MPVILAKQVMLLGIRCAITQFLPPHTYARPFFIGAFCLFVKNRQLTVVRHRYLTGVISTFNACYRQIKWGNRWVYAIRIDSSLPYRFIVTQT